MTAACLAAAQAHGSGVCVIPPKVAAGIGHNKEYEQNAFKH